MDIEDTLVRDRVVGVKRTRSGIDLSEGEFSGTPCAFVISQLEDNVEVPAVCSDHLLDFPGPCYPPRKKMCTQENDELEGNKENGPKSYENTPPEAWWRLSRLGLMVSRRSNPALQSMHDCCSICRASFSAKALQKKIIEPLRPNTILNYFDVPATVTRRLNHNEPRTMPADQLCCCSFCERTVCHSCFNRCETCRQVFCTLCSTIDYTSRHERSYCLDCVMSSHQEQNPRASPETDFLDDDRMQTD
jgi:hypothetical protein